MLTLEMFVTFFSNCFSSVYMALALQLNTGYLNEGPLFLASITFSNAGLPSASGLPLYLLISLMVITAAFATSIADFMTACFIASETAIFLSFCSLILTFSF